MPSGSKIWILISDNHGNMDPATFQKLLDEMPMVDRNKISKYRMPVDAQASLLGRLMLKEGLNKLNGMHDVLSEIQLTSFNRPYIPGCDWDFNISHSGKLVVCAISETTVGIDIELKREISIADFKASFTAKEFQTIENDADKLSRFYSYWVMKESVMKADGRGMLIPLPSIEIDHNLNRSIVGGQKWFFSSVNVHPDYCCCLATENPVQSTSVQLIKYDVGCELILIENDLCRKQKNIVNETVS
ncbi:MAG: 4'-phosphopantetheinyl transferase family protein [Flammeovirgaceae bacterium]